MAQVAGPVHVGDEHPVGAPVAGTVSRMLGYPLSRVATDFQKLRNTASWASVLLPFADTNGISYLGWTWDTGQGETANDLITDAAGDPTQGYGSYVSAHYLSRAAGPAVWQ